jgi:glycosyltransferase involved in cell wall biosynthesis
VIFYLFAPLFLRNLRFYVAASLLLFFGFFAGVIPLGLDHPYPLGSYFLRYNLFFMVGVALYAQYQHADSLFRKANRWVWTALAASLFAVMLVINCWAAGYNLCTELLAACLSVVAILGVLTYRTSHPWLTWIGRQSYTLYLTHFASIVVFRSFLHWVTGVSAPIVQPYLWILALPVVLLLSAVLFRIAESPTRALLRKLRARRLDASASSSRPSVCMLATDVDSPTGGIPRQSRRLLRELSRLGVKTYVCTRNYHRRPRTERQDGTLIRRSPVVGRRFRALNSLLYLVDTLAWMVRNRRRYDVIHCQQMFGAAVVGLLAKRLLNKPVLVRVTTTGELGEVQHVRRTPPARLRLRQLRQVDRWVALTEDMKREVLTLDAPHERVSVIPNSAVLPEDRAYSPGVKDCYRAQLGLDFTQVAVYTGRLSEEKGLDVLLHAWRLVGERLPKANLLLLGEGGEFRNVEPELRSLAARLGLEKTVHFCGHVPNPTDYLLASNLFVLPTRTEGMSNSLVEAMAAGAAIVTTDIPANRELIESGIEGLLVPPGNDKALAAAIVRVLSSPELAHRLGRSAREKAEGELGLDRMVSRYLQLYSTMTCP